MVIEEKLEFLFELDRKLHYVKEFTGRANITGGRFNWHEDMYTNERMTAEELEKALAVIKDQELVFYPINTSFGFSVGYRVVQVTDHALGCNPEFKDILTFREKQLPDGYGWEQLSKVFNSKRNVELLKFYSFEPIREKVHYEY